MSTLFDENRFESEIDSKVKTIVKNEIPTTNYYSAKVIRKDSEGVWWVRLDGNDEETPVLVNKVDMSVGDMVTVMVRDHQTFVDGNLTSPPMSAANAQAYVNTVVARNIKAVTADIGFLKADVATIGYAQIEDADITNARIQNLVTQYVSLEGSFNVLQANALTANSAVITNLQSETAKIQNLEAEQLEATVGYIEDLTAGSIEAADIIADHADITNLEADNATIKGRLSAAEGVINTLDSNYAHITNGVIDNAKIDYADVEDLDAHYAHITNGVIDTAKIGYADVNGLSANYAQINLANVNNAWIENGVVKDAAISDAKIIGVSANKLTAGTINAAEIDVTNLHASSLIVDKLNGQPVLGGYVYVNKNISGYSSKNPSTEGWYEMTASGFALSADVQVDSTKAYYTKGTATKLYDQDYIDGMVDDLNDRIDAQIETWTVDAVPTLNNSPAVNWTTNDLKAEHVGDICYVINAGGDYDGYTYRFAYDNSTSSYKWVLIKDNQVTAALGRISDLETFESTTNTWIHETDEGLETIRQNHTSLSGRVDATVVETTQLWYTKANSTAPSAPSSQVTSNSTSGGAWRTVVPTYSSSYPYYFYCWQYKYSNNTYGWSAVIYDRATTEAEERARTGVANAATAQTTADANIKSSVMLWFTKANETPPDKPTSKIETNNPATANAWNLAVPTYNSSYKYYFYCYQQQKGDGSYQWTDVVYDRATTESQSTARAASSSIANYITSNDQAIQDLQDQLDGAVDIWYGTADPTSSTAPWNSSDSKDDHVGDMYINTSNGRSFRYTKSGSTYSWTQIPNSDASAALAAAQDAQATADGKRRIFTTTPTVPYDVGDLWVNGDEVKYATVKKTSGQSYAASDWAQTATDDTMASANIKSSVMLWYTSNSTTPPGKPYSDGSTNYVSSTSTSGGVWTTVVPVYSASTPKYHYCYQQQRGDGKYQWTTPVYDDATTTAMTKAQAALPASTYNTFLQNTFKDVVDTVDEQSSTITQLTESVQYGGVNYIFNSGGVLASHLDSGNEYIALNLGQSYMDLPEGTQVTVSFDLVMRVATANPTFQVYNTNNDGPKCFGKDSGHGEASGPTLFFTAAVGTTISERVSVTGYIRDRDNPPKSDNYLEFYSVYNTGNVFSIANLKMERGSIATPWEYSQGDITSVSNTVNSVKQTATSNSSVISQLTTTLGTNADGTTKTNDVVHRMSSVEQDLSGFKTTVSETYTTKTEFANLDIGGRNLLKNSDKSLSTNGTSVGGFVLSEPIRTGETFTVSVQVDADDVVWASSGWRRIGFEMNQESDGTASGTQYAGAWWGESIRSGVTTFHGRVSATYTATREFTAGNIRNGLYIQGASGGTFKASRPKVEKGNKATDWTIAPEDQTAYADNLVDGISVGGRNLHKNSESLASVWSLNQATLSNGVATITPSANSDRRIYQMPANGYWTWTNAVEYTASIEARSDNSATLQIAPYGATSSVKNFTVTSDWKRYSFTFKATSSTGSTGSMTYSIVETSGKTLQVRRPKLEKGNKATDWTPAPEDIEGRVTQAETSISQTANAIGLTASGSATIANPNLSPFFEQAKSDVYNSTSNPKGYWKRVATNAQFTTYDMECEYNGSGGWAHFAGNATSGNPYVRFEPMQVSLKPSTQYTFLVELVNLSQASTISSINFQLTGGPNQTDTKDPFTSAVSQAAGGRTGSFYVTATTRADLSDVTGLSRSYIQVYGTGAFDLYARISLYEGEYTGPWKPYSGSQLYASQAELKVANDNISSKVSTTDYTGATITSLINQSADSVKIQANHVEINGATTVRSGDTATTLSTFLNGNYVGETNITTATDFNTLTESGVYYIKNGSCANAPTTNWGKLDVSVSGKIVQLFYPDALPYYYYRAQTSGTWSTWQKVDGVGAAATVQTNLDNLEVGGRNYAKTNVPIGTVRTSSGVSVTTIGPSTIRVSGTSTGTWSTTFTDYGGLTLTPGTYQLWLTNTNGGTLWFRLGKGSSNTHVWSSEGTYSHDSPYTFTVDAADVYQFGIVGKANTTYDNVETKYMLEKSSRATDWQPAPEDLASASDTVEYIVGTQTAATNVWTGVTKESSLVAGKTIAYKLPYAGTSSAATLNLTLSTGGTTGNIGIRWNSNNSPNNTVTTHFGAGSVINMTYDGEFWRVAAQYHTDTTWQTRNNGPVKAATAITAGRIIVGDNAGYRNLSAAIAFDLAHPPLYAGSNITAGSSGSNNYLQINITATSNGAVESGAAYKTLYLKGKISASTFTVSSSPFMTTVLPTHDITESGYNYVYMPLGVMTTSANVYFDSPKLLYARLDGKFRQVTPTEIVASQYIYCSAASASSTLPSRTSWIAAPADATSSVQGAWTVKRPVYSPDYPVLFICKQSKRLDGTITTTTPVIDDTTTVIDGGHVITGKVSANNLDIAGSALFANFTDLEQYVRGISYVPTLDSTVQSGKTYYQEALQVDYVPANVEVGESVSGLYERYNGDYVATSDTVAQEEKSYYRLETAHVYLPYDATAGSSTTDPVQLYEATMSGALAGQVALNSSDISDERSARALLEQRAEEIASDVGALSRAVYIDAQNGTVSVGYMTESGDFVKNHVEVNSDGFDVYYGSSKLGHYGETMSLGPLDGTHVVMSGSHMGFADADGNEVAYIDVDANGESVFYMTRSVVVKDMFFGDGKWKFYKRPNNNMGLKWMGD